jgi:hypothetical protein
MLRSGGASITENVNPMTAMPMNGFPTVKGVAIKAFTTVVVKDGMDNTGLPVTKLEAVTLTTGWMTDDEMTGDAVVKLTADNP